MGHIVLGIVIINTIASIIFAVKMSSKGQKVWLALFFVMFPVMGFLIYLIPLWILRIRGIGSYDRETLVKRLEVKQEDVMPVVQKELNVIPVEDAMSVSSNAEKRTLLLEQLKKDISGNYKTVLAAGSDSDSESAHYVAAAKMEVYRRKQAQLSACKKEWENDLESNEKLLCYLKELAEYIDSELLAEKEAGIYKKEYSRIVDTLLKEDKNILTAQECSCCLVYLTDLKQYEKAEQLWEEIPDACKNERSYITMMKMYYGNGNKDMFYKYLDELSMSNIKLSSDGLKMLRYWKERRV